MDPARKTSYGWRLANKHDARQLGNRQLQHVRKQINKQNATDVTLQGLQIVMEYAALQAKDSSRVQPARNTERCYFSGEKKTIPVPTGAKLHALHSQFIDSSVMPAEIRSQRPEQAHAIAMGTFGGYDWLVLWRSTVCSRCSCYVIVAHV